MDFSELQEEIGGKPVVPKGTGGHLSKGFFHSTKIYGVFTIKWQWEYSREKATSSCLWQEEKLHINKLQIVTSVVKESNVAKADSFQQNRQGRRPQGGIFELTWKDDKMGME